MDDTRNKDCACGCGRSLDRSKVARSLFERGYNCAQSVFGAFCDMIGLDFKTAMKLASSFGGGMGRMREVCGAVSAMFMVIGFKYGYSDPYDADAKARHYKLVQELAEKFRAENGTIICRELLGLPGGPDVPVPEARTEAYYKSRPCADHVAFAAKILDDYIASREAPTGVCAAGEATRAASGN